MIIVVPMAGRGSRFAGHEAELPKPLLPVAGRPMFAWALDGIRDLEHSRIVFVGLQEHERRHGLSAILREHAGPQAELVLLPEVTQGQLCSVLAAESLIDVDESVLIAPSDTYVVSALDRDIPACRPDCRGLLCVADLPGSRWSFARCDDTGRVVEVAEKTRISPHASTGHYFFSSGRELVRIGRDIVARDERTQGEFYVILVYRHMIGRGMRVELSQASAMWDMGTPEALERFTRFLESR
jgi:NDP-sugar pyrophosphorylase family protein